MSEEISYIDAEFGIQSNEKINFTSILMKQIDYCRYLRTQDMGQYAVNDLNFTYKNNPEKTNTFVQNSSNYQQSVISLMNLLTTYYDEEFENNLKQIKNKYIKKLKLELDNIKRKYLQLYKKNGHCNDDDYNDEIVITKRRFNLINKPKEFDEMFSQCMMLIQRAKFIGGNETISVRA